MARRRSGTLTRIDRQLLVRVSRPAGPLTGLKGGGSLVGTAAGGEGLVVDLGDPVAARDKPADEDAEQERRRRDRGHVGERPGQPDQSAL